MSKIVQFIGGLFAFIGIVGLFGIVGTIERYDVSIMSQIKPLLICLAFGLIGAILTNIKEREE